MRLLTIIFATTLLASQLQAQTPTINQAEARQELNEAARAYREGKFEEAQAHSEKALLLDPQNKVAPMFVARTIHAQYRPGNFTPENVALARKAIDAYKKLLERSPDDDESYKSIAYLYGALKEEVLLREWVLQRAGDASKANDKRAEAFVVLASKDWDCSFRITELPTNKVTIKALVFYRMPKELLEFEQARECANRGLGMANMAIALTPESESAWSYKTNLLLELTKLAEMSGDKQAQREFQRQYEEALKETTRLTDTSRTRP